MSARRRAWWAVAIVIVVAATVAVVTAAATHDEATSPRMLFADEFDGPVGPVGSRWYAQVGGGGWGNNEWQTYSDDLSNVRVDGDGHLAITARYNGATITSGRVTTAKRFSFTYGRLAARMSLPAGRGLHPALWLLGDNIEKVGWPNAGEIDVIETINEAADYHLAVHAPQKSSARGQTVKASGTPASPLAGEFHTYWMNKAPGRIEMGIDDATLLTVTPADLADDATWVFDASFHILINLAVGGDWPGEPGADTPNPSTLLVDWIRVTAP